MKPRVVMVGTIGCSKTTLLNKICNKNLKTYLVGSQDTKEPNISHSAYGKGFLLLDVPGFCDYQTRLNDCIGILKSITDEPINQLLFVVKFYRDTEEKLKRIINIFKRIKDVITVVITFFNHSDGQNQNREKIVKFLKQIEVESVIFNCMNTSGEELCNQIDRINSNSKQGRIFELKQTELFRNFNLFSQNDDIFENLIDAQYQLIYQFLGIWRIVRKVIEDFPINDSKSSEFAHQIILHIKDQADNCFFQFKEKRIDLFEEIYARFHYKELEILADNRIKKNLSQQIQLTIYYALQKMKQGGFLDVNFIKQCPYCGEIWIQPNKFEGLIFCGSSKSKDIYHQQKFQIKMLGCGKQLQWNDLKSLPLSFLNNESNIESFNYLSAVLSQEEEDKYIKAAKKIETLIKEKKIIIISFCYHFNILQLKYLLLLIIIQVDFRLFKPDTRILIIDKLFLPFLTFFRSFEFKIANKSLEQIQILSFPRLQILLIKLQLFMKFLIQVFLYQ
ncbi:unnamed protein product [Paramecium pentaurelia]|uniref:G domain-containing protein n=1 Tax=Paramecium pentaurelia TaxID=43138 RepID=A0A8S1VNF8_9CILI|nr:unnamed protein product [Paramecium pentaurelia]